MQNKRLKELCDMHYGHKLRHTAPDAGMTA